MWMEPIPTETLQERDVLVAIVTVQLSIWTPAIHGIGAGIKPTTIKMKSQKPL